MVSPWKNPLPLKECAAARVVICAYEERWIPISFTNLANAVRLYQKALLHGTEIFVFPPDLAPWNSTVLNIPSGRATTKKPPIRGDWSEFN